MQTLLNKQPVINLTSPPSEQVVLDDNGQVIGRITTEIEYVRSQMVPVTAWFTISTLLQHLVNAVAEGVNALVITADIEYNRKPDFEKLQELGATVYKMRQSGYRGMHHLFCIIDQRTAIHSSFNWTITSSFNTQESVIVTNHATPPVRLLTIF